MHANGITLSQPLGETIALVKAPGTHGTHIANQTGVETDFRGYTVVPFVTLIATIPLRWIPKPCPTRPT